MTSLISVCLCFVKLLAGNIEMWTIKTLFAKLLGVLP